MLEILVDALKAEGALDLGRPLIELVVTEVGSLMWGQTMTQFAHDHDYFITYASSTYDVLTGHIIGGLPQRTFESFHHYDPEDNRPADVSAMEISRLVDLLKKGNVNAMWAVMSPRVVSPVNIYRPDMAELRFLVSRNVSSMTYYSVRGMAISQMKDATKRANVRAPEKSLATAIRTLKFGHLLLTEGKINTHIIDVHEGKFTEEDVDKWIGKLDAAFDSSTLPKEVPRKPFDNFLYKLRRKIMMMEDFQRVGLVDTDAKFIRNYRVGKDPMAFPNPWRVTESELKKMGSDKT